MSKVVLDVSMSLDGFIAGANGREADADRVRVEARRLLQPLGTSLRFGINNLQHRLKDDCGDCDTSLNVPRSLTGFSSVAAPSPWVAASHRKFSSRMRSESNRSILVANAQRPGRASLTG